MPMSRKESARKAGLERGRQQREVALKKYYQEPNRCAHCGAVIEVRDSEKIQRARRRKYCNSSCAAKENNKRPKRKATTSGECLRCHVVIKYRKNKSGYVRVKYCEDCRAIARVESKGGISLQAATKGQLREAAKTYTSFRASVGSHARQVYLASDKPRRCGVVGCGYAKHFDVCHRKSVSSFSDEAKIVEINALTNLVALCKNHHWEFDNDQLEEEIAV